MAVSLSRREPMPGKPSTVRRPDPKTPRPDAPADPRTVRGVRRALACTGRAAGPRPAFQSAI
ncbi:hypothetical protein ACVNF4_27780 [Streptomyces sp. S6]